MITDPWFYIVAVFAVVLVGFGKGAFGGGMGVMAVPAMSLVVPPTQVAAIMLPLLCGMDLFGIWGYRKSWDRKTMAILAPAALLGILLGSLTFQYLNDEAIKLIVGIIAVAFCLDTWFRQKAAAKPKPQNVTKGGFWGAVSGFTSFVAHAGGPPANVYLLPLKLDKSAFVGTVIIFFTMINYIKLIPYSVLGLFTRETLITSLILSPLIPLGVFVGFFVHSKVSQQGFYRFVYAILFIMGLKLIYDGTVALWPQSLWPAG